MEMDKGKRNCVIRYIILFIVFASVAFGLYAFFSAEKGTDYTPPVTPVETIQPQWCTIEEGIELTGYVQPAAAIPVIPFVSGTIQTYDAEAGQMVSEGETIAMIDARPYELQKLQAEAQVKGLEAAFARVEALKEKGGATAQDYDTLSAQLEAARAQLDAAKLQLSYATVTAPVSGTIIQASSAAGSVASPQMPLAVIADLSDLVVDLKVGERYYSSIAGRSDDLKVVISTPEGAASEAEVISIAPLVDPTSKTFTLRVRLTDPEAFIPGMFVRASVVWSSDEYLTLPLSVRKLDGSAYAIAADGSSAEYIEMESIAEDDERFAIDPSYEGRMFISKGQNGLLPGEKVRVLEADR